jgi:DNA/RNA endonuclease YhcR with UshA esterase domain
MKTWQIVLGMVMLLVAFAQVAAAQTSDSSKAVPKYDTATEVTLKGTIVSTSERNCPVSGAMGFHFVLKSKDEKTIEVHVATSKLMKSYELVLNKGDEVEVVGSKVKFEDVDTIFARQITRGEDMFVFRFKDGKPLW